jgi:hypothetical protein
MNEVELIPEFSYIKLRRWAIDDRNARALGAFNIDFAGWRHPYTRVKSGLYAEMSVPIIMLARKLGLSPNQLTWIYLGSSVLALTLALTGNQLRL